MRKCSPALKSVFPAVLPRSLSFCLSPSCRVTVLMLLPGMFSIFLFGEARGFRPVSLSFVHSGPLRLRLCVSGPI